MSQNDDTYRLEPNSWGFVSPLKVYRQLWLAVTTLPPKPTPEEPPLECQNYLNYRDGLYDITMFWVTMALLFGFNMVLALSAWRITKLHERDLQYLAEMEPEQREEEFEKMCEGRRVNVSRGKMGKRIRKRVGDEKWLDSKV
ncbi:hypothetical protein N431DRAFT_442147 [Stipitochalara longipes BDJ]|nr:hypothetical protein N431DRAFT_442147 [Stipitochalara longipes BDJ]